ncbi:MAG: hypothetical protein NZ898_07890 [Myxococcota bacterium]|nr:hypothetical protein [Myxococcota bacterium]MDW8363517.1 hypothetical protein [Myxococcales bacterium]
MQSSVRRFPSLFLSTLVAVACGDSHTAPTPDAGITFDAPLPGDALPEGDATESPDAPAGSDIGRPCAGGADCASGLCIGEGDGFPGGYCTADCSGGGSCPEGSTCVPVDRGIAICLASCDEAPPRECRAGYGCSVEAGGVCLPGCTDDGDCPSGSRCDPAGGFVGAGRCFDPEAGWGDACADEEDCPSEAFCLTEDFAGWPGGACVGFGCDADRGTGCPDGAACIRGRRGGLCVRACTSDMDCRAHYACVARTDLPSVRYCAPACASDAACSEGRVCNRGTGTCAEEFDPAALGRACSSDPEALCAGGSCLREFDTGFPGSYCAYRGCAAAGGDCPGEGVCAPTPDGRGVCLAPCGADGRCTRDGYACRPVDATMPDGARACLPACGSDAVCANEGFVCNDGTGLCTQPFDARRSGAACSAASDCPGGRCLSEAATGWPGGMCVAVGCRLSGDGPAEPCPMGSRCVDDATGDPAVGMCAPLCDDDADCRGGYGCRRPEGADSGTCEPRCARDADCSGGRRCDAASGLCRTA